MSEANETKSEQKPVVICELKDVNFVWVADYYDMPLSGICRLHGKLHRFSGDYSLETERYQIYRMSLKEKLRWLLRKNLFEFCVGKHWTYLNGQRNYDRYLERRDNWFWRLTQKLYYKCK